MTNSTLEEKEKELITLNAKIFALRQKLTILEEERRVIKQEYEKLDRRAALTDGRFRQVRATTTKTTKPKEVKEVHPKDMTLEQIHELAKKLGVNLER